MRRLHMVGMILALALLLAGLALRENALIPAALYVYMGSLFIGFLQRPDTRATTLAVVVCCFASAFAMLCRQTDAVVLVVPGASGDSLVPVGDSAYRVYGSLAFAFLAGCWLGVFGMEAVLARGKPVPAGYAALPVRICAYLLLLPGCLSAAVPFLSERIAVPLPNPSVFALLEALSVAAVAACIACSRYRAASLSAILVYWLLSAFTPALFAQRTFFAVIYSILLCARGGREGFVCLLPVPAVIGLLFAYRPADPALAAYADVLRSALVDGVRPEGCGWLVQLYARTRLLGPGVAGALGGALCFFLGRLMRDSFLYAAPAAAVAAWGCYALLKGHRAVSLPMAAATLLFAYGLCLIAGAMRRAKKARANNGKRKQR